MGSVLHCRCLTIILSAGYDVCCSSFWFNILSLRTSFVRLWCLAVSELTTTAISTPSCTEKMTTRLHRGWASLGFSVRWRILFTYCTYILMMWTAGFNGMKKPTAATSMTLTTFKKSTSCWVLMCGRRNATEHASTNIQLACDGCERSGTQDWACTLNCACTTLLSSLFFCTAQRPGHLLIWWA